MVELIDAISCVVYVCYMQYIGRCLDFTFLPVASNDNDDLLSLTFPSAELIVIRKIKDMLMQENTKSGILLSSRTERGFFQEVIDAERYIILRYFTLNAPEATLRKLKRHILDNYLLPKRKKVKVIT